ncbi:hypothetical protein [Halalkalicoccus subterraneus]|uniref:hypothetical protein n=1 Tax=Halalkalicoccus subterraneus TaxID=2675002 RepID=UPI001FE57853|nr:hypothetical protein [Halalkalicoccus subterraneus]
MPLSRYSLRHVRKAIRDPTLLRYECRRRGIDLNRAIHARLPRRRATDVMAEDWDLLVILDGCRYDTFAGQTTLSGTLESRQSVASHSEEFLSETFSGERYHDTVYVTANPFAPMLPEDTFHATVSLLDAWDGDLQTVHPREVTAAAIEAADRFPEKRLLVHYMQPHYPFIGEFGRTLPHRGHASGAPDDGLSGANVWERLRDGDEELSVGAVRRAYEENLEVVLPFVAECRTEITGRSVVTADHGNLIGDRMWPVPVRGFGHDRGLRSRGLVRVPWLIEEGATRRPIRADRPVTDEGLDDDTVRERLKSFGYL